jgi:ABC-type dipeptide/oligopeptide/nickel transport system permease component
VARYAARRLLQTVPSLLLVYTVVFGLLRLTPGGPWSSEQTLSAEALANLNRLYGLDKPLWQQYLSYLWGALHGDLGISYANSSRTVAGIIGDFFPVSLQLGVAAMAVALALGISLGCLAAVRRDSWIDRVSMLAANLGNSIPSFALAGFLVVALAISVRLLPASGWEGIWSTSAIIPVVALAMTPAARLARFTRSSVLEVVRTDYIRTGRAKGLTETALVWRHALKNALIPVVTVASVSLAYIVTGSFFVETVCVVPGLGRYFVGSIVNRDYPVVLGTVLLLATIIALANLVADLLYGCLDPRIRRA